MYIWQVYINVNLIHQIFYFIYFLKSVLTDFFYLLPIYMQTSFSLKIGQTCRLIAIVRVATEKRKLI